MSQLDVTVREAAATSLGVLASHLPEQAAAVAAGDSLPLLVTAMRVRFGRWGVTYTAYRAASSHCQTSPHTIVQEPEPALKRAACAALGEIAGHTPQLAEAVVAAGALVVLVSVRC